MKRRTFLGAAGAAFLLGVLGLPARADSDNPLLAPWPGPQGGVPPLDRVRPEHFGPAFEASMADYRCEIAALAGNPAPATFANTIEALEDAGRPFHRARNLFDLFVSSRSTPEMKALETEWSPRFAAFRDEIMLDPALFARVEAVDERGLDPEQKRLLWRYHTNFVRAGAGLDPAARKTLSAYNQRLAELFTRFGLNQLADEENLQITLTAPGDLAGLPPSLVNPDGPTVIRNTRSSAEPFLTFSERRDLREKVWRMWTSRGEAKNHPLAAEILKVRAQRAKLLGYPTHAHWRLADTMAGTPERAMDLMLAVWKPAVARVQQEVADMQALAGHPIEPWDYRFYAEKVRKAKYDLDSAEIEPYLQLDRLREGMFWMAAELYDLHFREVQGLPVVHPDFRVFEAQRPDGAHVGYFYFDPFARDGKRSGAWMSEYRTQEGFRRPVTPIVSNNLNAKRGKPGEPVLLTWDDAETMFHEFGHALHGLLSDARYPTLAGTSTPQDFVEFPSQVHEHWLITPEILQRFALHCQTGAPMPADLVQRLEAAQKFNQGFTTVEFLASALIDMRLHLEGEKDIDTREYETRVLGELGMPPQIVMRHRIPHFGHVFRGDDYSAGYYSYLWSEVLDQDTWQAFLEAGGPWDKQVALRFRDGILAVGNTRDPAQAYRDFRGRDPQIRALLEARGFPVE